MQLSSALQKYHVSRALSHPGIRLPFYNTVYNVHLSRYKGTKDLIQIHKTLQTSTEDNAHHYKFMCFVVYSTVFILNSFEGETLFSLESSRKRVEKASGGAAGLRHWPIAPHQAKTPPWWKFSLNLYASAHSVSGCRSGR